MRRLWCRHQGTAVSCRPDPRMWPRKQPNPLLGAHTPMDLHCLHGNCPHAFLSGCCRHRACGLWRLCENAPGNGGVETETEEPAARSWSMNGLEKERAENSRFQRCAWIYAPKKENKVSMGSRRKNCTFFCIFGNISISSHLISICVSSQTQIQHLTLTDSSCYMLYDVWVVRLNLDRLCVRSWLDFKESEANIQNRCVYDDYSQWILIYCHHQEFLFIPQLRYKTWPRTHDCMWLVQNVNIKLAWLNMMLSC